jgi:hypothetical protein
MSVRVAFEVELNEAICVVFAATAAKARWIAVRSYWDANGRRRTWPAVKSKRAPHLDTSPLCRQTAIAWCLEHVMTTMS